MPRLCVACALAVVLLLLLAFTGGSRAGAAEPVSFIRDVAPVLQEQCFACHNERKKGGKYDMTRFDRLMTGGSSGEPVEAGKPEASDFFGLMVTHEERRMPPRDKGDAVPADKSDLVKRWIAEGAKLDAGVAPGADLVKELRSRWVPPAPPETYAHPPAVNAVAFTPDGKRLVAGGQHELTVWDMAGKLVLRVRTRMARANAMLFTPDGMLVVAGGRPGQEGDVTVYDLRAPGQGNQGVTALDGVSDPKVRVARLVVTDDSVLSLALSADGKRLAAGGCDRLARVWDVSGGSAKAKLVATADSHSDWVLGVALSADGKRLATASRDKTAKVFDLAANESTLTFPDHRQPVYAVAFSADGGLGFSAGADKELRAWKPDGDGKQTRGAGGHSNDVFRFAVHPDANLLASASADGTVRLWDAKKLESRRTLEGLKDYVYAVAFSPDGKLVAAGSYSGEVRVWTTADGREAGRFVAAPGLGAR